MQLMGVTKRPNRDKIHRSLHPTTKIITTARRVKQYETARDKTIQKGAIHNMITRRGSRLKK